VPQVQLDAIPPCAFSTHTVVLEGVDRIDFHRSITSAHISFISEKDNSTTELQVYNNAKFKCTSYQKKGDGENYVLSFEDLPRR
jgi:hypothetical protein